MNKTITTTFKGFEGFKAEVLEVLPVKLPYRPKELYRVKYENGKTGLLEVKDFKYKD